MLLPPPATLAIPRPTRLYRINPLYIRLGHPFNDSKGPSSLIFGPQPLVARAIIAHVVHVAHENDKDGAVTG